MRQNRKWQKKDEDVGNDIASGINIPLRQIRDAVAIQGVVPELRDRLADEDAY
jgi:hypothetical protein